MLFIQQEARRIREVFKLPVAIIKTILFSQCLEEYMIV